ncbi:zinc finger, RING/FYVE/PHD-type containing protein [Tanacetum coccineum]
MKKEKSANSEGMKVLSIMILGGKSDIAFILLSDDDERHRIILYDSSCINSCLPCGHIFGMSCILNWLRKFTHAHCLRCNTLFALKDVRILYVNRLCIPTADDQKNAAMKWRTNLLNSKEYAERRAKALERRANAIGLADPLRWADAL